MTATTLRVRPINDTIGAHVEGVDLGASLDDDIIRALRRALLDHLVLFFRDQDITPEQQLAFTERFAPVMLPVLDANMEAFAGMMKRFTMDVLDPVAAKAAYEAHNQRVRDTIPADRLLEWRPGEGWGPICAALGLPVPDEAFPHANTTEMFNARIADIAGQGQ